MTKFYASIPIASATSGSTNVAEDNNLPNIMIPLLLDLFFLDFFDFFNLCFLEWALDVLAFVLLKNLYPVDSAVSAVSDSSVSSSGFGLIVKSQSSVFLFNIGKTI
jgi:hypothetical protein